MAALVLPRAGRLPAAVRARDEGVAARRTHRQSVRRSESDLRVPADGGLRRGGSVRLVSGRLDGRARELLRLAAIAGEQLLRNRTWNAGADDAAVDSHHGAELARRARDERLVGGGEVRRVERLLANVDADIA